MARVPLIDRLPRVWRNLDTQGQLDAFLKVLDSGFDSVHSDIGKLFDLRNVDQIPDRYLYILADLVGHVWNNEESREWNRRAIATAIHKHSYKGTVASLSDNLETSGVDTYSVQDNASRLLVLGKQGRLGCSDSVLMSPEYWHDGAFVLKVPHDTTLDEIEAITTQSVPAGEIWFYEFLRALESIVYESNWSQVRSGLHSSTDSLSGAIGYGMVGINLFLSVEPNGHVKQQQTVYETAVSGGYLQIDSSLRISAEVPIITGSGQNPLRPEHAILQVKPVITHEDI